MWSRKKKKPEDPKPFPKVPEGAPKNVGKIETKNTWKRHDAKHPDQDPPTRYNS